MSLDTEILLTAFVLLRLRVLLFGEIKRYKSPIRIRVSLLNYKVIHSIILEVDVTVNITYFHRICSNTLLACLNQI